MWNATDVIIEMCIFCIRIENTNFYEFSDVRIINSLIIYKHTSAFVAMVIIAKPVYFIGYYIIYLQSIVNTI